MKKVGFQWGFKNEEDYMWKILDFKSCLDVFILII